MRCALRRFPLFTALSLLLVLAGCGGGGSSGGSSGGGATAIYETTSLSIAVGDSTSSSQSAPLAFLGTFADVTRVEVVVSGPDIYGVQQNPLATVALTLEVDGVWRGTIPNLPVGPTLTFSASGYDAGDTEIFSGVTTQALTGSSDQVTVAMTPVDDGQPVLFPIVQSITLPAQIVVGSDAAVAVAVKGSPSETLDYTFFSAGGTFVPDAGSLGLPTAGTGTINTTYTAPGTPDTYLHSVRVTNSQNNSVETDFPAVVVYDVTDAGVTTRFAPVVTALLGKRTYAGNTVTWTATVSDDKPLSALTYSWGFSQSGGTPGAAFSTDDANPGVMSGYDQTVTGSISFTVSDGDGLSTTVTFTLVPGQFPDNVVGTPPPAQSFTLVGPGWYHSLALRTDASVWGWGGNSAGELGTGSDSVSKTTPIQAATGQTWSAMSAGQHHTLALKADGTLWAWGYNYSGQLGTSAGSSCTSSPCNPTPTQVGTDSDWAFIATSNNSSYAIKSNGTLWAWGFNGTGELGDGTTTQRNAPVQVGSATNWSQVVGGTYHALGLRTDGTLWSWGGNQWGQLGDGTTTQRASPAQVGTGTDWLRLPVKVSEHSLALKTNGTLWAWGYNANGGLGNGTTTNSLAPVQVGSATSWVAVSAGSRFTIARRSDGTLWSWGFNGQGQLGDGSTTDRHVPGQVGSGTNWGAFATGIGHTMALHTDGTLRVWGLNAQFQLGTGTTSPGLVPGAPSWP